MTDMEKVIKGLKCCLTLDSPCGDCPYYSYEDIQELECERNLRKDAIDLLKEYETTDTNDLRVFHCQKCGYGIEDIFISEEHNYSLVPKFCPNCGRKVGEANA